MIWLRSLNLYAVIALVALGGTIVTGIYMAGARNERNKVIAETMTLNTKIIEARAEDRAAIAADAARAAKTDAEVKAAVRQKLILTKETARLLASVK